MDAAPARDYIHAVPILEFTADELRNSAQATRISAR
jgi:hypothetical protein